MTKAEHGVDRAESSDARYQGYDTDPAQQPEMFLVDGKDIGLWAEPGGKHQQQPDDYSEDLADDTEVTHRKRCKRELLR